ncbi:hypothetical protein ACUYFE_07405 [Olegusella massiliensis]|uniref:hypothetical protein n=1 Tax=Olegusella massiliensis TaxID=1776381 RepID=UPI0040553A33
MKPKFLAVMAASAALALSLTACGSSTASPSNTSGKTSKAASSTQEKTLNEAFDEYVCDPALQDFKGIHDDFGVFLDALRSTDLETAKEAKAKIDKKCDDVINLKVDDRIASAHDPLVQAAKAYQSAAQYYIDAFPKVTDDPEKANVLIESGNDKLEEVSAYMESATSAFDDLKKRVEEEK